MLAAPDQQISLTDPDARSMRPAVAALASSATTFRSPSTRTSSDLTHEVTNVGTDRSQLAPWPKETKATLESEKLGRPSPIAATSAVRRSWHASRRASQSRYQNR